MTTRITVDAHAGWPVEVTRIYRSEKSVSVSHEATVSPGGKLDVHVRDGKDLVIRELRKAALAGCLPLSLDFSDVVRGLKAGKRYARAGWNGKGMFVFLVAGSRFNVNREPLLSILGEGTEVSYRPHIDIKGVDGSISTWVPSIGDVLAEDWQEV